MKSEFSRWALEEPYFVAPMVGLSHYGFRELIRAYTPPGWRPVLFTEMLSTRRLPGESLRSSRELQVSASEKGRFVPQILGNEEKYIGPSIAKLLQNEPWGIDINMGCPVNHTLRHNWGFRLVGQPQYAAEVVKMARKHTPSSLPLSVKLRGDVPPSAQLESRSEVKGEAARLVAFASRLQDAGADWLTIHPRPGRMRHKGVANWEVVAEARKHLQVPVVLNGDIQTAQDARFVVEELGCAGAMFARSAVARPWIFWQLAQSLGECAVPCAISHRKTAPEVGVDEGAEFFRALDLLIDILWKKFADDRYVLERVQFFAAMAAKWYLFGHDVWKNTTKAKTAAELRGRLQEYSQNVENPSVARVKFL